MNDGLAYLVSKLLIKNGIKIDNKELQFQIKSHPSYPSMHAITGVLNHFSVDNLAIDIPKNKETLAKLPNTFLAQRDTKEGKEFVVATNKGLNYQLINSSKKNETLSIENFLNQFTGIIIGVEKTEYTKEFKNPNLIFNKTLAALTTLALMSLFLIFKPTLIIILYLMSSILGLVISIAIKKQEQGEYSMLGNAFCSGESEKKDCNAVLSSNGAMLIGNYKLSDLSIIYFSFTSLSIFSLTLLNYNLSIIYLISLSTIPITLYSIYYQAFKIKKWCFLCLSIVGVLWAQAAISIINAYTLSSDTIVWIPLVATISLLLLTLTIYNKSSSQLGKIRDLKQSKIDFYKFKRNFNLFETLLQKSKTFKTINNQVFRGIIIGNQNAELKITVITNPFCGHCKPVHALVEDIYKKYTQEIAIQIYFSVNPNDKESKSIRVVTRLLEIYHTLGLDSCLGAMHAIYKDQDAKLWFQDYGTCCDTEYYIDILEQQYRWCIDNGINFTPEILVNGKSYPNEYNRTDLLFFIEDLHENCCVIDATELQLTI